MTYNGHKNWSHWNVALWIANDYGFYWLAVQCINDTSNRNNAAEQMLAMLRELGIYKTPDGATYNKTNIRAAMVGW